MSYQSHTPESVVHFEKIGQIAVTVTDLARARDFYLNTLGMRFLFETGPLVFFQCGDIRLMLSNTEASQSRGGTVLYFKVEDIHVVYEALKARSVNFVDTPHLIARMPDHDLWMVFLKDPDENLIGVMCEIPQPDRPEFMPK
ncbi:VOC family protein [Occallatibacter riparius]|uniref:VOC family protein n=1 Tax=Occallatibacter riparius TaxID=1002689 RepID=A0A9J7BLN8_9BACT|nr:VOC family protein [Occallatibacter riparius]UWZ82690.1 VOC family protein [Occallatibacter riparius]